MAKVLKNQGLVLLLNLVASILIAGCELPITPPPIQPPASSNEDSSLSLPVVVLAPDPIGHRLICNLLEHHLSSPSYHCVEVSPEAGVPTLHFDYTLHNPSLDYGRNIGLSTLTAGSVLLVSSSATVTFSVSLQPPGRSPQTFRSHNLGRSGLWFVMAPGKGLFGTSFGTLINSYGGRPDQLQHSCLSLETPSGEREYACKLYRELLEDSLNRSWPEITTHLKRSDHSQGTLAFRAPARQKLLTPAIEPAKRLQAQSTQTESSFIPWADQWYLSIYHSQAVRNNFGEVVLEGKHDFLPSYLDVLALSRALSTQLSGLRFEVEGQLGKHSGMQDHWETNLLLVFRWQLLDDSTPVSIAYGDGFSYAEAIPQIELEGGQVDTRRLLPYFMVELDMGLPTLPAEPKLFFRIHHRSGMFGLFCKKRCASNFPALGLKFKI